MKKKEMGKKEISAKKLSEDYDIAYDFATKVYKKFQEVIKSIVLFGSIAKGTAKPKSDIDIIIIIDDATINWDEELIAWYREELGKITSAQKYAKELHVNTVTLTAFWEELREGEPIVINILRYGQVLIDFGGFFDPLRVLLAKGRIRPSPEAVFVTMERALSHGMKANNNILASVEGFYWAMVDAGHAALMAERIVPPSPEHLADLLTDVFVKSKRLEKKFVEWYEEVRILAKEISYGNVRHVRGETISELQEKSDRFVRVLSDITKLLIKEEKIIRPEYKSF